MSNAWQTTNAARSLTAPIPARPPSAKVSRVERETPRSVKGLFPSDLRIVASGLDQVRRVATLKIDTLPVPLAERQPGSLTASGALGPPDAAADIPRTTSLAGWTCPVRPLSQLSSQDPALSKARVETLNGRLAIRSRMQLEAHGCLLNDAGPVVASPIVQFDPVPRELLLLDINLREAFEPQGPVPVHGGNLAPLGPVLFETVANLPQSPAPPRVMGSRFRIPIPDLLQPE